ncbi:hypothetical protein HEK616_57400 [Streptomyces nigrescens]|uniref:Uncharacterized protein n=1 Tax=Streptomyces nigrescens TaxID=1920 RepID=A0ABN6R1G6_STRNI|nr:hypothetical protein HEK616_57400 [Streptomyces nigrescens]
MTLILPFVEGDGHPRARPHGAAGAARTLHSACSEVTYAIAPRSRRSWRGSMPSTGVFGRPLQRDELGLLLFGLFVREEFTNCHWVRSRNNPGSPWENPEDSVILPLGVGGGGGGECGVGVGGPG